MLQCTSCRRSQLRKGHKEQERRVCAANCLIFLSCLMVRMINEWLGVHGVFRQQREGLSWLLGRRKGTGSWTGGKREQRLTMSLSVLPITKMGTCLMSQGEEYKKICPSSKLIDARLTIFNSLHSGDVTMAWTWTWL